MIMHLAPDFLHFLGGFPNSLGTCDQLLITHEQQVASWAERILNDNAGVELDQALTSSRAF